MLFSFPIDDTLRELPTKELETKDSASAKIQFLQLIKARNIAITLIISKCLFCSITTVLLTLF